MKEDREIQLFMFVSLDSLHEVILCFSDMKQGVDSFLLESESKRHGKTLIYLELIKDYPDSKIYIINLFFTI